MPARHYPGFKPVGWKAGQTKRLYINLKMTSTFDMIVLLIVSLSGEINLVVGT